MSLYPPQVDAFIMDVTRHVARLKANTGAEAHEFAADLWFHTQSSLPAVLPADASRFNRTLSHAMLRPVYEVTRVEHTSAMAAYLVMLADLLIPTLSVLTVQTWLRRLKAAMNHDDGECNNVCAHLTFLYELYVAKDKVEDASIAFFWGMMMTTPSTHLHVDRAFDIILANPAGEDTSDKIREAFDNRWTYDWDEETHTVYVTAALTKGQDGAPLFQIPTHDDDDLESAMDVVTNADVWPAEDPDQWCDTLGLPGMVAVATHIIYMEAAKWGNDTETARTLLHTAGHHALSPLNAEKWLMDIAGTCPLRLILAALCANNVRLHPMSGKQMAALVTARQEFENDVIPAACQEELIKLADTLATRSSKDWADAISHTLTTDDAKWLFCGMSWDTMQVLYRDPVVRAGVIKGAFAQANAFLGTLPVVV